VKEDRPGHKAGLIKGDIIIQLGTYNVTDIYAYMEALGKFEKGQTTDCKILRNGEEMTLKVTW
jgi:S1-C subfamily serine protease